MVFRILGGHNRFFCLTSFSWYFIIKDYSTKDLDYILICIFICVIMEMKPLSIQVVPVHLTGYKITFQIKCLRIKYYDIISYS